MIRPPPRSPLFPYTPLFRSGRGRLVVEDGLPGEAAVAGLPHPAGRGGGVVRERVAGHAAGPGDAAAGVRADGPVLERGQFLDRKSTRLNSSHSQISYAVFCL